jgi:pimeloyl-ACP methyl ester carboxylesterase
MDDLGVLSSRVVEAGGVGLEILEAGEGGDPLLVLHGFCGAKENFSEAASQLAERGWHVVVPDQRGHGVSAHPAGTSAYSFDLFVSDALALVDALGWRRFVLIGHSMGGMVAQQLALTAPDRLRGLVLMDTFHAAPQIDEDLTAAGRKLVEDGGMAALVEAMRGLEGPLETEAHRRLLAERPGYQELTDAQTVACSADMWLSMSAAILSARDTLEDLRSLRLPVLVVVGEQDEPFLEASHRMAETIPGSRLAVIPDGGHSPQLEAPEAWTRAVSSFLGDLPGPNA